ncbi:MAG: Ca-activated chloride channel [Alphaproteobacteria bacterium]|jgi:Ca-activated chloride channel family protein|nr:Ca-activated chloride channel [Alphaproteobacteria bacterium]
MRFLQPQYLFLFLLLLVLLPLSFYRLSRTLRLRSAASAPLRKLSRLSSGSSDIAIYLSGILALVALIVVLAQPQWVRQVIIPEFKKMDLVFLVDTSPSMRSEDIRPSRLQRALEVIAAFCDHKPPQDRIGLIAFTGKSVVLSYLTEDPDNIRYYLNYLRQDKVMRLGTNIGRALNTGLSVLNQEREIDRTAAEHKRVFILISDGEDHGAELADAVSNVKKSGVKVHTIATGSAQGAPIPMARENGQPIYLLDDKGQRVISRLDEGALRWLANETGGGAYRAITGEELPQIMARIVDTEREIQGFKQMVDYRDLHQEFLFAAFGLFLTATLIRGARV